VWISVSLLVVLAGPDGSLGGGRWQKIALTGVGEAHIEIPMILCGMEQWATPELRERFMGRMSAAARYTLDTYWTPVFKSSNLWMLQSLPLEEEVGLGYLP
jgi:hypothetical protein